MRVCNFKILNFLQPLMHDHIILLTFSNFIRLGKIYHPAGLDAHLDQFFLINIIKHVVLTTLFPHIGQLCCLLWHTELLLWCLMILLGSFVLWFLFTLITLRYCIFNQLKRFIVHLFYLPQLTFFLATISLWLLTFWNMLFIKGVRLVFFNVTKGFIGLEVMVGRHTEVLSRLCF